MPTYIWLGINHHGQKISGTESALNQQQLKTNLKKQNILPLKITYDFSCFYKFRSKITTKQIAYLIEQLTLLINANTPIVKALKIIGQNEQHPKLKDLIINCQNSIYAGNSLYQTLRQYPQHFTKLLCSLINVGEQSGTLDLMLSELSHHLKKIERQKQQIIKALLYPMAILVITLIVTAILLIFVIPQFETMFASFGATLPLYTQIIIYLSKLLQTTWKTLFIILIATIISIRVTHHYSVKFQYFSDKLNLKIPLLKNILLYTAIIRLTKTLGLTLKSGVPLLTAIDISITTIPNQYYQHRVQQTIKLIANGKTLHSALHAQNLFPHKVIQLIALGEETGTLDSTLEKIASVYNEELNKLTDNLNTLLEPAIMLILGTVVGSLIIGMYLPIFRLGTII